jgi:hypothetical protein
MNEYLKPIFKIVLPKIEQAGIDYWVYGGIANAAYNGDFFRINQDVDIFLMDADFEHAKSILYELCQHNNFKLKSYYRRKRPKIKLIIDDIERFSMTPICHKNGIILFKHRAGDQEYPDKILEKIERNISGFRFFTPNDYFIKILLLITSNKGPMK